MFNSDSDEAGLRRRENGKALGIKDVDSTSRIVTNCATPHAGGCARRAPFPARHLPPRALEGLDAMPKLAVASDFASQLAVETDAEAVSRELYDRLRSEAPDSIEARQYAVYWNFPKLLDWRGFCCEPVCDGDSEAAGRGYRSSDFQAYGVSGFRRMDREQERGGWPKLGQGIAAHARRGREDTGGGDSRQGRGPQPNRPVNCLSLNMDAYILNFFDDVDTFLA